MQDDDFFSGSEGRSPPTGFAARLTLEASVNASRTPRLCFAEHSTPYRQLLPTQECLCAGYLNIVLHGFVLPFPVLLHRKCISRHISLIVLLSPRRLVNHTLTLLTPTLLLQTQFRTTKDHSGRGVWGCRGGTFTVSGDFVPPFFLDVFERVSWFDTETEHNDMCIRIRQRSQSIKFFLSCPTHTPLAPHLSYLQSGKGGYQLCPITRERYDVRRRKYHVHLPLSTQIMRRRGGTVFEYGWFVCFREESSCKDV